MKKIVWCFVVFTMFSCGDIVEKPSHLIPEEKMANLISELTISDQLVMAAPSYNTEAQTRFVLKKEKVNAKQFYDSYQYYTAKGKMPKLYDKAQEIILNKDPKARIFIEKKDKAQDSLKKAEEFQLQKTQN